MREFADGQCIAHGNWKIGDEICFVGIEHRAFDDFSAERIGTIQNVKRNIAFGGFFHGVGHGDGVSVKADAGILNIEDQRVDSLQHFVGGPQSFAVERENLQTG